MNLKKHGQIAYRTARLIVVCVVGATLMLAGIVMLITPGPGWAAIAAALAVLSIEFAWARRWLLEVKKRSKQAVSMVRSRNGRRPGHPPGKHQNDDKTDGNRTD